MAPNEKQVPVPSSVSGWIGDFIKSAIYTNFSIKDPLFLIFLSMSAWFRIDVVLTRYPVSRFNLTPKTRGCNKTKHTRSILLRVRLDKEYVVLMLLLLSPASLTAAEQYLYTCVVEGDLPSAGPSVAPVDL